MSTTGTVIRVTDKNIGEFLNAERAVLILTRSTCGYCAAYQAQVEQLLERGLLSGAAIGAMVLDVPGVSGFKRDNPWLGRLGFLPYNLVYRAGRRLDGFGASRPSYLLKRADAAFAEPH